MPFRQRFETGDAVLHAASMWPGSNGKAELRPLLQGYGTAAHMLAIGAHGPCAIHRMSFAPMKHVRST